MISIESTIYKYLHIFINDIHTTLWTPKTQFKIHTINVREFLYKSNIKS